MLESSVDIDWTVEWEKYPSFLEEYGGHIADALSISRIPLGLVDAFEFIFVEPEDRGAATIIPNVITDGTDAIDGWVSRKALHRNPKGGAIDKYTDKVAQNMRRLALWATSEIHLADLAMPPIRDYVVDKARDAYESLGITDAHDAKISGKVKTGLMAGSFLLSASRVSFTKPKLVRASHHVSTASSVVSGVITMTQLEKQYQEESFYNLDLCPADLFLNALGRTALYICGKDPSTTLLTGSYDE